MSGTRPQQRLRSLLANVRGDSLWLSASPLRAVTESLAIAAVVVLSATRFGAALRTGHAPQFYTLILFTGPFLSLWCAVRLRMRGPLWRSLAGDALVGLFMGAVPATLVWVTARAISARVGLTPRVIFAFAPHFNLSVTELSIAALCGFAVEFVGLRVGVRLWRHWNQLRRARLRWALTHAHLVVVLLGAASLGALLFAVLLQSPGSLPLRALPILFILAILTVLALAVVLPPSALFSYLFARSTTRRLEALTNATNQLRAGHYEVRVPVDGADEVAQLQANFNAMAADLARAVAELQNERDRVAMLLQARRELVASVSHELRTPLATLRGYLESALSHWDATPPETLRHDLTVMDHETGHLQTLINDLFTLARAEVGKLDLRTEPTDVGQLARQVVEVASPAAWQSSRIELLAEIDDDLPLAQVDAGRVRQILHNLVHNATRHTPPGGIVVVEARTTDDAVTLSVKDTGEGIAPDELPLIWQRFYRGQSARHVEGSSGLGLALVKELAGAMGGAVSVASTPGQGSAFSVRLPRAVTSASTGLPGHHAARWHARRAPAPAAALAPETAPSASGSVP